MFTEITKIENFIFYMCVVVELNYLSIMFSS